jgi:PTS system nitrogen regulatory IIA component
MDALHEILSPGRTLCRTPGASKKRLFQTIARTAHEDQETLPYADVLDHLVAREKLGSTGLGDGIAIPHCRIDQLAAPIGILITLDHPLAFDAPDDKPVDLIFALLVPQEANQQHLDMLAEIARHFSQADFCASLRAARDDRSLYEAACAAAG